MIERRVPISREATNYAEKVLSQRAVADAEAVGFVRGLALGMGIDPATVARVDTDADELVIVEPESEGSASGGN